MGLAEVRVSVVIPARDVAGVIGGQLGALAAQRTDETWEVVVADNGSTDATRAEVERWAERFPAGVAVRVVDAADRPGINHARNRGVAEARGAVLLFCDADDEADPGWMAAMAAAGDRHDVWGGVLDRRDLSGGPGLRDHVAVSTDLVPWVGYLPFAPGANLGLRRTAFDLVGGFDETYRGGADDVDLCWRVQERGGSIGFVPDAVMHYRERTGLRAAWRQHHGYGRQDPHLHRDHRASGMPPSRLGRGLSAWAHLLVRAPRYWRTPAGRAQWVRSAGRRTGRIAGSVRYRTLYL